MSVAGSLGRDHVDEEVHEIARLLRIPSKGDFETEFESFRSAVHRKPLAAAIQRIYSCKHKTAFYYVGHRLTMGAESSQRSEKQNHVSLQQFFVHAHKQQ